jgi:hypothetical protein
MASAVAAFLRDPLQNARREELRAFIGPDAEKFLKTYDVMQATAVRRKGERPAFRRHMGFVTLAFLLGPCWFCYRRLWGWAAGVTVAMVAIGFVPLPTQQLGIPFAVAISVMGRTAYLNHAMARITALRGNASQADPDVLRRAGGVSMMAGWISGVVMVLLIAAAIAAIFIPVHPGNGSILDG